MQIVDVLRDHHTLSVMPRAITDPIDLSHCETEAPRPAFVRRRMVVRHLFDELSGPTIPDRKGKKSAIAH